MFLSAVESALPTETVPRDNMNDELPSRPRDSHPDAPTASVPAIAVNNNAAQKSPRNDGSENSLFEAFEGRLPIRPRVSVAVDPVALITTECITVTSAMRKHSRWAGSSVAAILSGGGPQWTHSRENSGVSSPGKRVYGNGLSSGDAVAGDGDDLAGRWGLRAKKGKSMRDNPLMAAFARLRRDLHGCESGHTLLD